MPIASIISQCEFQSAASSPRTIWIQRPLMNKPTGICLFLDGEYFVSQVKAAPIISKIQCEEQFPPMLTAYLSSHPDSPARWTDSFCNEDFANYLVYELLPWLAIEFGVAPGENILAGLSLTGLSAVHAALKYPAKFQRVLSMSGSFWWDKSRLTQQVRQSPCSGVVFRLTVGTDETKGNTTHNNHGFDLTQTDSQIDSNRMMRDALILTGHQVSYLEHPGGHDFPSWRAELENSLIGLLALPIH